MNQARRGMGMALAGLLVGIGVAVFAKAVMRVGFDQLTLEHILGPGMVLVGLLRLRLQRVLDARPAPGGSVEDRGDDGDPT